ncbi:MAG: Ig-like domain-containing protein [Bacteroides sp.]
MRKTRCINPILGGALLLVSLLTLVGRTQAQKWELSIRGEKVTQLGKVEGLDGEVKVSIEDNTLVLDLENTYIRSSDADYGIFYNGELPFTIRCKGSNKFILDKDGAKGICSNAEKEVFILGDPKNGSLAIFADEGIVVAKDLSIGLPSLHVEASKGDAIACSKSDSDAELDFHDGTGLHLESQKDGTAVISGFKSVKPELGVENYEFRKNVYAYRGRKLIREDKGLPAKYIEVQVTHGFRGFYVGGVSVKQANEQNIPVKAGKASYNPTTHTLTLENASIKAAKNGSGIRNLTNSGLTVLLTGSNHIVKGEDSHHAIQIEQSTVLTGEGTLNISDSEQGISLSPSTNMTATLTVKETTLKIHTKQECICSFSRDSYQNLVFEKAEVALESDTRAVIDGLSAFATIQTTSATGYVFEKEANGYGTLKDKVGGEKLKKIAFTKDNTAPTPYPLFICGVQVNSANAANFTHGVLSGAVSYDNESKTLTLTNATLEAGDQIAIDNQGIDELKIVLASGGNGVNELRCSKEDIPALKVAAPTRIKGDANPGDPERRLDLGKNELLIEKSLSIDRAMVMSQGFLRGGASQKPDLYVKGFGFRGKGLLNVGHLLLDEQASIVKPQGATFDPATGSLSREGECELGVKHYGLYFFNVQVTELNRNDLLKAAGFDAAAGGYARFTPGEGGSASILELKGEFKRALSSPSSSEECNAIYNEGENLLIRYEGVVSLVAASRGLWVKAPTKLQAVDGSSRFEVLFGGNGECKESGIEVDNTTLAIHGQVIANGLHYGVHSHGKDAKLWLGGGARLEAVGILKGSFFGKLEGNPKPVLSEPAGAKYEGKGFVVDASDKTVTAKVVFTVPQRVYEIFIGGTQLTSDNINALTPATFSAIQLGEGGSVVFEENSEGCRLSLKNAKILTTGNSAHAIQTKEKLSIYSFGQCEIASGDGAAIHAEAEINCLGGEDAKLTIAAKGAAVVLADNVQAAFGGAMITITSQADVAIKGGNGSSFTADRLRLKGASAVCSGVEFRSFDDGGIVAPIFGRITPTGAVDANDKSVNEVEFDLVTNFGVEICGRRIHSKNYNQLEKLPGVKIGEGGHLYCVIGERILLLFMKNVTIEYDNAIRFSEHASILCLEEVNTLRVPKGDGIVSSNMLSIRGVGELNIEAMEGDALAAADRLSVMQSTLKFKGKGAGMRVNDLQVQGATLSLIGEEGSLLSENEIVYNDAKLENATYKYDASKKAIVDDKDNIVTSEVKIVPEATYYGLSIAGEQITSKNLEGSSEALKYKYDPEKKLLTLSGEGKAGEILSSTVSELTVRIEGETKIEGAINLVGNTTIEMGAGASFTQKASEQLLEFFGTLTFKGGEYTFLSEGTGILSSSANGVLRFDNATLDVQTGTPRVSAIVCKRIELVQSKITLPVGATIEPLKIDDLEYEAIWGTMNGEKVLAKKVKIEKVVALTGIAFDPASTKVVVNQTRTLASALRFTPENATNQKIKEWKVTEGSENLAVDAAGVITGVKKGTAKVVATSEEGNLEATCTVTVIEASEYVPLTGISLTETSLKLKVGTSANLRSLVKYTPDNAMNKNVTWAVTEGEDKITVAADGTVTATQTAGLAKVTVTSEEGGHTATCEITVTAEDVPVESITVLPSVADLTVGATQQLLVRVNPLTATNKTATWAVTEGADVVSVSATGVVTTLKEGTAKVTATVEGKTATCTVNVKAKEAPKTPDAVEDAVLASVVVAPNPFSAQLRIVNPEGVAATYELVTLSGVVVRAGVLEGTETVVDSEALPAGLYFVRVTTEDGVQRVVRVVKY